MARKLSKPFRMAPWQKLAVKPIEDPAERAALDERLKRSAEGRVSSKAKSLAVLERCRQFSAEGRILVAAELLEQPSVDERMELLERMAAQLPPEARRRVEDGLRRRVERVGDDGNAEDGKRRV
jgi:hypothetical protein